VTSLLFSNWIKVNERIEYKLPLLKSRTLVLMTDDQLSPLASLILH